MTSQALAIVFSPNVVKAPGDDLALAMANMNFTTQLVKTLITHVRALHSPIVVVLIVTSSSM